MAQPNAVQQSILNRLSSVSSTLGAASAAAADLSGYAAQYNAADHKALADKIVADAQSLKAQVDALSATDAEAVTAG